MSVGSWLAERTRGATPGSGATVSTPSFVHALGWTLVILFGVEAVTGLALAAFYAPTTNDAWASIAYMQDQMSAGWLIRGLHHHGASALVIVAGLHLVQTAVWGAYKKPRELVWWIGIVLLLVILAFAITGYVLRWDQSGYWANQVEVGIAAGAPVVGGMIKKLALGGNDYGNLTLTRFYALHVTLLPGIVPLLVVAHIKLSRRHGATSHWASTGPSSVARWPQQTFRAAITATVTFAALLAYVVAVHGADLSAPADPSAAFDARPLWYFRWLFALRHLAGSAEQIVAMVVPAVVIGALVAMPLADTSDHRHPLGRKLAVGGVVGAFAIIGALTVLSFMQDARNEAYKKRVVEADKLAMHLRALAVKNGVPTTGPQDLLATQPMYRARVLYKQYCADCHEEKSKDRKGPIIAPGHGNRAWLAGMLKAPGSDAYWGHTKLATSEAAMKPVELAPDAFGDVVEALYAESGATDVDAAKRERGKQVYNDACNDCHSIEEGAGGGSAPGLGGLKSREWYVSFISNPKSAQHMGADKSEMPRFDKDLTITDRDLIAQYLVWLRSATPETLSSLGPLSHGNGPEPLVDQHLTTIAMLRRMPSFEYQEILPAGHHESTPYKLLTSDHVSTFTAGGRTFLDVKPEALTLLAKTAMRDIAHLLRPGHLAQLRKILDDPEASSNDRFVALELLKNANVAAGYVLPGCQDTGTAIVMGKRGVHVVTDGHDEAALSRGVFQTYTETNLRYSQVSPIDMFEEKNTGTNLPAQIELYATEGDEYHFMFMAKGGGSANKSMLFQETKALLNEKSLTAFLEQKLRSLGTAACPPYHLAVVIGGTSAEHTLKVAKLASARYLDDLPTTGGTKGHGYRDVEWEARVVEIARQTGIGAQFGGKYFVHDARVIRLPRHGASCPVAIAVSCSADRQALGKITKEGVFLEQLEADPAKYLPDVTHAELEGEVVKIDLTQPMSDIRATLSRYPIRTRLSLTGPLVVARDIAHAKLKERLDRGEGLPPYMKDHAVYYAGPAKTPEGYASGSFGPTTAGRMDSYVDAFQAAGGSMVMLAKGNRSQQVTDACKKHGGFYLGSIGGPAAVLAKDCIKSVSVLEYAEELGMEAIWKIDVVDFPAFIVVDDKGNDFFANLSGGGKKLPVK